MDSKTRFISSHIPLEDHLCITLYGVVHGVSKSRLLRMICNEWLKQEGITLEEMQSGLVKRVYRMKEVQDIHSKMHPSKAPPSEEQFFAHVREAFKAVPEYIIQEVIETYKHETH